MKWFFLSLLFLIVALYIFIQSPYGQNWIGRQVTKRLSYDLQTKISIQHVDFSLFNRMHLHGVLIADRSGDTLLYAGDVKVRITDWFFFKKEVDLKYIGLENAIVKFQRTDSVWRQQFFLDYFSSPSTGKKKKNAGIQLSLEKIELQNVAFVKKDDWLGQSMLMHVDTLRMDADKLSLSGNKFLINSLKVASPTVTLYNYTGLKPHDSTSTTDAQTTAAAWNTAQTIFQIGELKIVNGIFKTDKQSSRQPFHSFDGEHILFTEINAELKNSDFTGDTILSKLTLNAKERSGLEIKNLTADLKMTPQEMAFSNLDIQTNKSHIRNYFRMSFKDFSSMADFIHAVNLQGDFDNSEIDSDDIAFFAPSMKSWKKKIIVKGKVRGTVDALVGRDMIIQAGNSTLLNGDISLTGLPDINETFIDLKANEFRTTYGDAVTIVPAMRRVTSPDLKKIQYVSFKGSFTGFIRDFVTFGTIKTNLGTLTTDLNMKLPRGQEPVYSGKIATDNFRLGEFLGDKNIGSVSLTATVKGKGFSTKTRSTLIDGTIRFADYKNYRYQNITVKGKLDKNLFEGQASFRDENADLDLDGIIDLNNKIPLFNLKADVTKANLKNLKLTNDDFTFRGKLDFNFNGNTIDNFLGTAKITDAEITKNGRRLPFDSLVLSSTYIDNEKKLTAVSNEFNATIRGDFSLHELPAAFTFILNKYYPAYIKAPAKLPRNQHIQFDIAALYADEFIQLIDSGISGFNNSHIAGSLNLGNNDVNFRIDTASIPQFKFRQYVFDDVNIKANGNNDSLIVTGNVRDIRINDSLHIAAAVFKIKARNDSSTVTINTGTNQAVEKASINALVLTYNDGVKIEFDPSNFTINGKTWTIDQNGELEFRRSKPAKGQLVLKEGEQKIMLKTQPSAKGAWNDLKIELTKINVGDFSPYFLPNNRLEGLISGNVLVENPTGNLKITSDDIQTQFLRFDNDSLGEVKTSLSYDNKTKELIMKGNTLNMENYLGFDVNIFIGDPLKAKNNLIALKARNYQIKVLERFLGTLFSDMQGYLTGDVNLKGDFANLAVTGKGRLKDAGLKVNFTQVFYKIKDTDIELTPQEINLDGIVLTDTVTGNPIYIKGGIEHESFKNMFYDLYISTRKPGTTDENNNRPIQLINTTYKNNNQFYGNVKGTGSLSLAGPQADMYMKIDAFASTTYSSNITIPSSTSRESGLADFLVERKFGREMSETGSNDNKTNIIYDVDVTANPMLNVKVVLDELTGDEIKGKGTGTLKIRSGTSEPLSLRGRFDIDEGNYLFTFQSFFKKPFVLKKGADNFIEWNGDPFDARINLTATYTANNVSYAPLIKHWSNIDQKISGARSDVYVVAKLTDKLFSPQINFSLEFPPSSVASEDPALAFSLQQLQKNINEMNKQATYLVVFGIFAPIENSGSFSFQEVATNSLSGIFFNVINEQVRKIVSNIFKSEKLNFNFNSSVYNRNVIDAGFSLGSNVNASIGSSLFKDKVIISLGGSVENFLPGGTIQQNVQLLPNASIEILLNESGTFRANLFYRQNIDYLTTSSSGAGKTNRAGLGFSYRKEADTFWELFFKKKKKTTAPQPVVNPDVKKEGDQE